MILMKRTGIGDNKQIIPRMATPALLRRIRIVSRNFERRHKAMAQRAIGVFVSVPARLPVTLTLRFCEYSETEDSPYIR